VAVPAGSFGVIGRFFGNTVSAATGYAFGVATGPVLSPALELLRQESWKVYPDRLPDLSIVAEALTTKRLAPADAYEWAERHGYSKEIVDKMVKTMLEPPRIEPLLVMHRRKEITDAELKDGMIKQAIDPYWHDNFVTLSEVKLSPADVANAVQQGFMVDDGLLPADQGGSRPFEPPVEVVNIDPLKEAETQGIDRQRLQILAELSGNPPGPMELLSMWNRGIITEEAVNRGVREGRTKTKWTSALKELRHYILSPAEAAGLRLRGWIDAKESYRLGAMSGADPEIMDRLFLNRGRPATTHQVWIGLARGGKLEGPPISDRDTFKKAVVQSDIRPEYEPLLWAQRYSYPSAFVLRGLANSGDLTEAQVVEILHFEGWEPNLAKQVAARWAGAGTGKGKEETRAELADEYQGGYITEPEYRAALAGLGYSGAALELEIHLADARRVKKYREKVVATIEKSYLAHHLSDAEALTRLAEVGVTGEAATLLVPLWTLERDITAKQLTAAQVKKAYKKALITLDNALVILEDRGYTVEDATTYLAS
jgi:hypothetical protein